MKTLTEQEQQEVIHYYFEFRKKEIKLQDFINSVELKKDKKEAQKELGQVKKAINKLVKIAPWVAK